MTTGSRYRVEHGKGKNRTRLLRRPGYIRYFKMVERNYDAEIIAFTADIGQKDELDGLEEKALATGASKVYIDDLRDEFAQGLHLPDVPIRRFV